MGVRVGVPVATEVRRLEGGILGAEQLHGGGLAVTVGAFAAKVCGEYLGVELLKVAIEVLPMDKHLRWAREAQK